MTHWKDFPFDKAYGYQKLQGWDIEMGSTCNKLYTPVMCGHVKILIRYPFLQELRPSNFKGLWKNVKAPTH